MKHDNKWRSFGHVLARYKIPYSQRLSMQLARFPYKFAAKREGKLGKKITKMKVGKKLHQYLARLNATDK